ncbi:MAG: HEPN domain-containing protein [Tepidisphaeraceae bacterium]
MNETVKEWMVKAEDDYRVAVREFEADPKPSFDAACFHAQQCVEKLMKAVLIQHSVLAPRTHDLLVLSHLLTTVETGWVWSETELESLNRAAVNYRYPGETAARDDAAAAVDRAGRLSEALRRLIEPEPSDGGSP